MKSLTNAERRAAVAKGAKDVLAGLPADRQKAILAKIEELITEQINEMGDHGNDRTPYELKESAYRRGYHQATWIIHELLSKRGFAVADNAVSNYERVIYYWRFRYGRFKRSREMAERAPEPGEFEVIGDKVYQCKDFRYGPISNREASPL